MKKAILVAAIGAMTLGVNAGDWGKAPVGKAPIEECVDIGGSISSGYMSDYIFYGYRFARDSVCTDVNYTIDNLIVPINIGAWYLNGIGETPGYDELDLYVSAELGTFAGFDSSLGYTYFFFPEGAGVGSYGEVGLDISRSLGFVDFAAEANYAMLGRTGDDGGAWYYQAGISKEFGLTDAVSLVLSTGVGYSDGYASSEYLDIAAGGGSGWNHYYITAELPIVLNCRAVLTPYLSYTGAPDTWVADGADGFLNDNFQSDILSAGVTLSVSF